MASKRSYLSGAMKRKQREARLENAAKTRRAFEDLSWCIKTTTSNETDSELHNIGMDQESETSINIYDHPDIATTPTTSKSLSENQESSTDQQISNLDDNKGQQSKNSIRKIALKSSQTLPHLRTRIVLFIVTLAKPLTLVTRTRLPYQ